ncbi:endocuticle structural glycoprotein SgAbd-1-like [Topomyia yanbarensis]|uniref:endocuticle structural glycoprotein SgAbd-1-like n=1 Tax=Topomyia yanbarensis TaxID=2498891 RepID=UPI00273C3609|nr:endocuticle structural glycoprotein SgAbd-1-like [Topomyia yanbarensis]
MKMFAGVLVLVLTVGVSAAPQGSETTPIPIVSESASISPDGAFAYAYETGNGIKVDDQGEIKVIQVPKEDGTGTEQAAVSVQHGSYSYKAPDGTPISVQWTADENGFKAQGDHLPVAPSASS